jgi:hypothetical protein
MSLPNSFVYMQVRPPLLTSCYVLVGHPY